jgi:hypothetical protein
MLANLFRVWLRAFKQLAKHGILRRHAGAHR